MTKRKRTKRKLWSVARITHPQHPGIVLRLTELKAGGNLYVVRMVDGKQRMKMLKPRVTRLDLGSNEREQRAGACARAFEIIAKLAKEGDDEPVDTGTALTLATLATLYEVHGLHGVGATYKRDQLAKLRRIGEFLGQERLVVSLCRSDVEAFTAARMQHVTRNTIHGDVLALKIALNWAVEHKRTDGQVLLDKNPLQRVRVRKDPPRRPWATVERYEALQGVADRLEPAFGVVLTLAWESGHRINAILSLKWRDVSFKTSERCPNGAIRWYADVPTTKKARDHVVPMNPVAAAALVKWREVHPGVGAAPVFPSRTNPSEPVRKHVAEHSLRKAEQFAQLAHEPQGGWHMFRRGFATARKDLPLVDVAAAGGWKDTATVLQCYQHADEKGTLAAILNTTRSA